MAYPLLVFKRLGKDRCQARELNSVYRFPFSHFIFKEEVKCPESSLWGWRF
jgi:hypothetical protein